MWQSAVMKLLWGGEGGLRKRGSQGSDRKIHICILHSLVDSTREEQVGNSIEHRCVEETRMEEEEEDLLRYWIQQDVGRIC